MHKSKHPGVYRRTDGRWFVKIKVRVDGRHVFKEKLLPEGATKQDAARLALDLRGQARAPEPTPSPRPPPTSQTVEQYSLAWLRVRSQRLKPSAAATYAWCLADRILPRLGWLRCDQVNRQVVEAWVVWCEAQRQPAERSMTKSGKTTSYANPTAGQPYAQDTMRQWWRVLCTLLGDMAADLGLPSATTRVRAPERPDQDTIPEQRTLDGDMTGALLDAAKRAFPDRFAEVAVMLMAGMRAGEVFALKWDCIDFTSNTMSVRRAISGGILQETTKTKTRRVVPMHPELVAILLCHRQAQVAAQHKGLGTGLVFPSDAGGLRDPGSTKKMWPALRKELATDIRFGPQVLRRTFNTLMVLAGVDRITLRSIMGHTSEAMTQRYAGVPDDKKAEAVQRLRPIDG